MNLVLVKKALARLRISDAPTDGPTAETRTASSRVAGAGIVLAAVVAGFAFTPVFSFVALVAPLTAVLVAIVAVDLLVLTRPVLIQARAPLALIAGAVAALAVLTVSTGGPLGSVLAGAANGWLRTLESTFPARPDPELLTFVPLLVLLAAVLGVEWLRRELPTPATFVPSLGVLLIAQLYQPATGWQAMSLALGYGVALALVLSAAFAPTLASSQSLREFVVQALPLASAAAVGVAVFAFVDPFGFPSYSVHDRFEVTRLPDSTVNPLTELGGRLAHPDTVVFTAETTAPVDRWPLVVLDRFDGVGWSTSSRYRPLGTELPDDASVTAATELAEATIRPGEGLDGPWMPSQYRTARVDGIVAAVDPVAGTLVHPSKVLSGYRLSWRAPAPTPEQLAVAPIDVRARSLQLVGVPAGIVELTKQALPDRTASLSSAFRLEQWFRANYTVAEGADLPTGSGTAQLLHFLNISKRGTSEQFAAAYVLMARTAGLPVRLVVGFHNPAEDDAPSLHTVRNRDAFAWPEIAIAGLGWIALDPTPAPTGASAASGPSSATEKVRQQLPQTDAIRSPAPTPVRSSVPEAPPTESHAALILASSAMALLIGVLAGVPVAKQVRRARRRRSTPDRAVVGAWLQARDTLRDHGVRYCPGMTVRDLRRPAESVLSGTANELEQLARCLDMSLWSGRGTDKKTAATAWAATAQIERVLAQRPASDRARAAINPVTLRSSPTR